MAFWGFLIALWLFWKYKRHWGYYRRRLGEEGRVEPFGAWGCGSRGWGHDWPRHRHGWERDQWREERRRRREARRARDRREHAPEPEPHPAAETPRDERPSEEQVLARAKRRAAAEMGFYIHFMSYLGVIAFLAFINLLTTWYPWVLWPAAGWGLGLFFHWMGVFGMHSLKARYFDPAVEREVRRETAAIVTDKQASIDDLSATIAHEIRNPIAAAKSLVQQMGEDPASVENVEYGKVALEELDRVEKSISHLLKYAKEEELQIDHINLASVVDSALTQMRAKLDEAKVAVTRNYIGGPTIAADGEKLRQVFANVIDNAIDALGTIPEGRKIDLFIENGRPNHATVRVRDNGAGIPPEKVAKIFNPFFTTKEKGTGLGMAISKKIVESHQGAIEVESEVGRGTEFLVYLPLPTKK